jgi:hypothetical protein
VRFWEARTMVATASNKWQEAIMCGLRCSFVAQT